MMIKTQKKRRKKNLAKVKNIGFAIDGKLHGKMKIYLLLKELTIKDYITSLIEKDIKNKKIYEEIRRNIK